MRTLIYFLILLMVTPLAAQVNASVIRYSQSPINIQESKCILGEHRMNLHYEVSSEHIEHAEHLVELNYDSGSFIEFDDEHYDLKQFHFHTPSEHWLNDIAFPVEMHMVHASVTTDELLVIAFLFEAGESDPFIEQFLKDVPEGELHIDDDRKFIDINQELLPESFNTFFYYHGSLTTPPFSENVNWIIDRRIHKISQSQIDHLVFLEGDNHRGVQNVYDRVIEKVKVKN